MCSARVPFVYLSQLWFAGVVSQGSYHIPQLTLVCWGGQPDFLLYTPADSGLLGWSARAPNVSQPTLVHWVNQPGLLFYTTADSGSVGMYSQGSYYIPQLTLVCWNGQLGFLMNTPANSGIFGWSARVPFVYTSRLWFIGVVSQGSYCILKLTSSLGWSTRVTIAYHSQIWFTGVDSQGSYCMPQLTGSLE